ncbi:VanZ family protein [Herminiimonas sp. CN]|uniref:VanZ family protein n=1 Tax=Herminiimonas sp. CN TaxID=1349818 RepID=UPI0004738148|nr:VanZ family protein [Herminiimonas sp. CN]
MTAAAPQSSPLARIALLAYLFLIVYASLFPFTGWRDVGLEPWDYLSAPLPKYWTKFDVLINIAGYIPLGMLVVYALHPWARKAAAVAIAILAGGLVSGTMEAVQQYLPSRVSSVLDLYTNFGGVCIGALLAAASSAALLERGRLRLLLRQWFQHDASGGMILLALWPLAQIFPQGYLFGHGQIVPILADWLSELLSDWLSDWHSDLLSVPIQLETLLGINPEPSLERYWLLETLITASGLCGAVLLLHCVLRKGAPKIALTLILVGAALATKSLANALLFAPENAFAWLTAGARGGLLVAALMLSGLIYVQPAVQKRLALLMLTISLLAVNSVPANPYFVATLQAWVQGKFLNFNGAAHFLSLLWPFLALWLLWRALRCARHQHKQPL